MGRQVDSFCKVFCKQHLNACSNLSNLLFSPYHNAIHFFFFLGGGGGLHKNNTSNLPLGLYHASVN